MEIRASLIIPERMYYEFHRFEQLIESSSTLPHYYHIFFQFMLLARSTLANGMMIISPTNYVILNGFPQFVFEDSDDEKKKEFQWYLYEDIKEIAILRAASQHLDSYLKGKKIVKTSCFSLYLSICLFLIVFFFFLVYFFVQCFSNQIVEL